MKKYLLIICCANLVLLAIASCKKNSSPGAADTQITATVVSTVTETRSVTVSQTQTGTATRTITMTATVSPTATLLPNCSEVFGYPIDNANASLYYDISYAVSFTASASDNVTHINVRVSNPTYVRAYIYTDAVGYPQIQLGGSLSTESITGWNLIDISDVSVTMGTNYWIVVQSSSDGISNCSNCSGNGYYYFISGYTYGLGNVGDQISTNWSYKGNLTRGYQLKVVALNCSY